jgi:hypothetical protein
MQETMVQYLMQTFSDPKFTGIVDELCELQGRVHIVKGSRTEILGAIEGLLGVISDIVKNEREVEYLDQLMNPNDQDNKKLQYIDDVLQNIETTKNVVTDDSGFEYTLTALWLFRTKIVNDAAPAGFSELDCPSVLAKLDTILAVIGLTDISTTELWKKAAFLGTQRDALWNSVKAVLKTVEESCSVSDASS